MRRGSEAGAHGDAPRRVDVEDRAHAHAEAVAALGTQVGVAALDAALELRGEQATEAGRDAVAVLALVAELAEVDAEVHVTELGQEVGAVGEGGVPAEVEAGLVEADVEVVVVDVLVGDA